MCDVHSLGGIHGVIAHDVLDFNTLDAAFGIPFVHSNLSRVIDFHARRRCVTGKGTGISDMDAFFDIGAMCGADKTYSRKYRKCD